MGIKTMFKKKDPTEQELVEDLNRLGVSTKSAKGREEKFGAFKEYAQERQNRKPGMAPKNPYASASMDGSGVNGPGSNPYASGGNSGSSASPYGGQSNGGGRVGGDQGVYGSQNGPSMGTGRDQRGGGSSLYGRQAASPYGAGNGAGNGSSGGAYGRGSPYGQSLAYLNSQTGYSQRAGPQPGPSSQGGSGSQSQRGPYSQQQSLGYNQPQSSGDPYSSSNRQSASSRSYDTESLDLNAIPLNQLYGRRPAKMADDATLDLNALPEEDDLNVEEELPEEQQVNSEDEEVEGIKQDIRFVKQESVALTRNTLRMAQEADASATNTMGMLGLQSERLYNAEQNLLLADTQTNIARDKVSELKRLNRSIFVPAQGNPFNRKSRLRQQEENIKAQKLQEKYLRETNRQGVYASEQRLKQGISANATSSETHRKYKGDQSLAAAQRYQFENDSEDDEMEKELATNLDQIGLYLKKLKNAASTMGEEVESQNKRLRDIEENADRLDINVHMNSARLSNIR